MVYLEVEGLVGSEVEDIMEVELLHKGMPDPSLFLLELLQLWLAEQLLKWCIDGGVHACEFALKRLLWVWSTLAQLRTETQLCTDVRALTWVKVGLLAQGKGARTLRGPLAYISGSIETTVCTVACDLIVRGRGRIPRDGTMPRKI